MISNLKVRYVLFGVLALFLFILLILWITSWLPDPSKHPPSWTGFNVFENEKGMLVNAKGDLITAKTLWDWLDLLVGSLIVGMVLAIVGRHLPVWIEEQKAEQRATEFEKLIRRELKEMNPHPPDPKDSVKKSKLWFTHLRKGFIHEEIFMKVSDNRDFILSIEPTLAYHEAQLWTHFSKAKALLNPDREEEPEMSVEDEEVLEEHAEQWQWHLGCICKIFDGSGEPKFKEDVYDKWAILLSSYFDREKMDPLAKQGSENNCF